MSSAPDPLGLAGTTIADKYAIESVVGEGGFAVVYRATHLLWKRPVALKVFKVLGEVGAEQRKQLLEDFIREGALLADLSERSTAICQARDVGTLRTARGEDAPYMVLEWLEGRALDDVLEDERAAGLSLRSLEEAVRLLDPIAEALALAHKKGIAHRDVKPANVFVLGDPRGADVGMKLLDFGIAKVVQDAQRIGFGNTSGRVTSFTPSYGAPEQFNRSYGATGPWTDVFALALLVVEVTSGREPLSGETVVELALASAAPTARPTPRHFGVETSDEVEAIFQRAVAVQPDARYPTAGAFWSDLRSVVLGQVMPGLLSERMPVAKVVTVPGALETDATLVAAPEPEPEPVAAEAAATAPAATSVSAPTTKPFPVAAAVVALAIAGAAAVVVMTKTSASEPPPRGVASAASPSALESASAPASASGSAAAARPLECPPGMRAITGGEYFMGSDEKDAEPNERPPHKVMLSPYCLDELEVTVAEYKACSDRGACLRAGKENDWNGITALQHALYDPLCNITDPEARARHPVNCVSWEQASTYCAARGARLPTEAEWEFAARGSDGRVYPWGDDPPSAKLLNACGTECLAWMKEHRDPGQPLAAMFQEDDGYPTTAPVGSFPAGASSWGIQDIAGNVWEWVADWYGEYDAASATTTTSDPSGPNAGTERVIRGGAWNGARPAWVRPSWRFRAPPSYRTHGTGFRCAKSP